MKKTLFLILVFILIGWLCSCEQNQDAEPETLVPVVINISQQDKALVAVKASEQIASYQYKATSSISNAYGEVDDWASLSLDNNQADLGSFSQGKWTFFVRSLDSTGMVLYEGSSTAFLSGAATYNVTVFMSRKSNGGTGTVQFEISCPAGDNASYSLSASYKKVGTETYTTKTDFSSSVSGSDVVFSSNITLAEGSYEFNFSYFRNNVQCGGETIAFDVVSGKTQILSGKINSRISYSSGLAINKTSQTQILEIGSSMTFVWESNGRSKTYQWYVNGTAVEGNNTASFKLTENQGGVYTVSCNTSDGETASCSVRVCYPISVSFEDLIKFMENTSLICKGFKVKGSNQMITSYNYKTLYCLTPTYSSLDDLNLEPVTVSTADEMASSTVLVIGKNAPLPLATGGDWLGRSSSQRTYNVKKVYTFKDPASGCIYSLGSVEEVYVMDCVTSIAATAFYNMNWIKTVRIGSGVTSIGNSAFQSCSGLTTITIPKSVSTVGLNAFSRCTGLTTITVEGKSSIPSGWNSKWLGTCTANVVFKP